MKILRMMPLFLIIFILLVGCKINEQIFNQDQNKLEFFVDSLKFDDYSTDKVYIVFNLHNDINEPLNCSVKINLYKNDKLTSENLISENIYYISDIEGGQIKKIKILIDMPKGKTKVSVKPLCEKIIVEKETQIEEKSEKQEKNESIIEDLIAGEEKQEKEGFLVEDLELKSSSINKGILIFKLKNVLDETANCSAKVIMVKDNTTISEDIYYVGYLNENSEKIYEILINLPQGQTLIDVVPLCTIED